ncbi:MAG: hypothetical protein AABX05_01790, partial [Nanoarchaeota archaeon]
MTTINLWKYAQADIDVENNPYLNPEKPAPAPTQSPAPIVTSLDDFLIFKNIVCVDANNTIIEQYPELKVRKDIFRDQNGGQVNHSPYDWIVDCERNGLFLPS